MRPLPPLRCLGVSRKINTITVFAPTAAVFDLQIFEADLCNEDGEQLFLDVMLVIMQGATIRAGIVAPPPASLARSILVIDAMQSKETWLTDGSVLIAHGLDMVRIGG